MKWFYRLLVGIVLLISGAAPVAAADFPEAPTHFYLDQLNILDSETKQLVNEIGEEYKTTAAQPQLVIGTIESTGELSIDSYATTLFNKWGIGQRETNNGILILYALNDGQRNVRLEVGKGLKQVITDNEALEILLEAKERLKSTDAVQVNEGLRHVIKRTTEQLSRHYELSGESSYSPIESEAAGGMTGDELGEIIKSFLLVGGIILMIILSFIGGGSGDGNDYSGWGGGGSDFGGSDGGFSGGGGSSDGGGGSI